MVEVKERLAIFSDLKTERINYDNDWQIVSHFVYTQKANFTSEKPLTNFTNQDLFDKTGSLALMTRSSTLESLLWNSGQFAYRPNPKYFPNKTDHNEWFQYATNVAKKELEKAEADRVFFESEMDEGAFSMSYVFLDGANGELNLSLFQVKECYINETIGNKVDSLYRNYNLTVKVCVDTFGINYVSDKTRDLYNRKSFNEKVNILHIIQPRRDRNPNVKGKDSMPFESVYIDIEANKELQKQGVQGGFNYFPVFISREGKRNGEKYGYSPAMMAIEEIAQLNKMKEDLIVIMNRFADPAIGYNATALQGNVLNLSPGSSTPWRGGAESIFDMIPTKGDPVALENSIVRAQETVNQFFGIDKLLDFNNQNQMTAFETNERARMRQQTLGATLMKKRLEKYKPIVERTFHILFEQGKFGYLPNDPRINKEQELGISSMQIPEDIAEIISSGFDPLDLFEVEFFTQFELEKKLLQNETLMQVWNNAGLIAQLTQNPAVFDNLNQDKTIKELGDASFKIDIYNDDKEVEKIRIDREAQMKQQQQIQEAEQMSKVAKNIQTK